MKGPLAETIKVDAEIDAIDQLEITDSTATQVGLHPQIAVLELIVSLTSAQLQSNNSLVQAGTLKIVPMEAPLTLFVCSKQRILPNKERWTIESAPQAHRKEVQHELTNCA